MKNYSSQFTSTHTTTTSGMSSVARALSHSWVKGIGCDGGGP